MTEWPRRFELSYAPTLWPAWTLVSVRCCLILEVLRVEHELLYTISYPGSANVTLTWCAISHHVNVAFVMQSSHLRVVSIAQLPWIISPLRSLWWEGLKALVHEWLKCWEMLRGKILSFTKTNAWTSIEKLKSWQKKSKRRKNKKPNGDLGGSKINSWHESLIKKEIQKDIVRAKTFHWVDH